MKDQYIKDIFGVEVGTITGVRIFPKAGTGDYLKVDKNGNPHICAAITFDLVNEMGGIMKYVGYFNNYLNGHSKEWSDTGTFMSAFELTTDDIKELVNSGEEKTARSSGKKYLEASAWNGRQAYVEFSPAEITDRDREFNKVGEEFGGCHVKINQKGYASFKIIASGFNSLSGEKPEVDKEDVAFYKKLKKDMESLLSKKTQAISKRDRLAALATLGDQPGFEESARTATQELEDEEQDESPESSPAEAPTTDNQKFF